MKNLKANKQIKVTCSNCGAEQMYNAKKLLRVSDQSGTFLVKLGNKRAIKCKSCKMSFCNTNKMTRKQLYTSISGNKTNTATAGDSDNE